MSNIINVHNNSGEDLIEFVSIKGEKSLMQKQFFNTIIIHRVEDSTISFTFPSGFTQIAVTKSEAIRVAQLVFSE